MNRNMGNDILVAIVGLGLGFLILFGLFLGIKTKKGRKFLGIE